MEIQNKEGGIVEIDGRVRIEPGPRVLTADATPELLDDAVTARHYRPPFKRIATVGDLAVTIVRDGVSYIVGDGSGDELRDTRGNLIEVTQYTVDALGTPIVPGETITYVDWRSKWRNGGPGAVWNIYSLEEPDGPAGELLPVWRKKGDLRHPGPGNVRRDDDRRRTRRHAHAAGPDAPPSVAEITAPPPTQTGAIRQ